MDFFFSRRRMSRLTFRSTKGHWMTNLSRPRSHRPTGLFVPPSPPLDPEKIKELQRFITLSKKLIVMTGAGISTESGIPDYRSEKVGLYARTDRRPIQHIDFIRSAPVRQRYWARNFVGWPQFSSHQPNPAHWALSNWEKLGKLHWLVTQNVDALHSKAGNRRLTELHGCMHRCWSVWVWPSEDTWFPRRRAFGCLDQGCLSSRTKASSASVDFGVRSSELRGEVGTETGKGASQTRVLSVCLVLLVQPWHVLHHLWVWFPSSRRNHVSGAASCSDS